MPGKFLALEESMLAMKPSDLGISDKLQQVTELGFYLLYVPMQRVLSASALEHLGAHLGACRFPLREPRCVIRKGWITGTGRNQCPKRHSFCSQYSLGGCSFDMVDPRFVLTLALSGGDDAECNSVVSTLTPAACIDEATTAVVGRDGEFKSEPQRTDREFEPELLELDLPVPLTPFSSEYSRTVELERAIVAEAAMNSKAGVSREDVIFEDEWLLVFNKPSGIYSEHVLATVKTMLRGHDTTSDAAGVSIEGPDGIALEPFAHLANRLDRDTSGVLVLTKCKEACRKLTEVFTKRQVEKTYIARCAGQPPTWSELLIQSGHGRSRFGAWRVYSVHDIGKKLPGRGGSTVKDMKTRLHIVGGGDHSEHENLDVIVTAAMTSQSWNIAVPLQEPCPESEKPSEVLLRAFPLTGRTHQIRLHCCYLGLPLIGDVKYGGPHEWNGIRYDGHCLHAESLSFTHPVTFQALQLVAPRPNWAEQRGLQPSTQYDHAKQGDSHKHCKF